jgi:hypothetical protein
MTTPAQGDEERQRVTKLWGKLHTAEFHDMTCILHCITGAKTWRRKRDVTERDHLGDLGVNGVTLQLGKSVQGIRHCVIFLHFF